MGYIRIVGAGKSAVSTYVIRKRIAGKQFEISTRRNTADAAVVEYRRFEQDPHGYNPLPAAPASAPPGPTPVVLASTLQEDYLRYSAKDCRNTEEWFNKKRRYLEWWAEVLRNVNLRDLDMEKHVFPKLKHRTGRPHAIAIFKHFIGWLRDPEHGPMAEYRLRGDEGRCVIDYEPSAKKHARQETAPRWFPYENWLLVRPHLSAWMQDAGDVLAATGWHATELLAFVRRDNGGGLIEDPPGATGLLGTDFTVCTGDEKVQVADAVKSKVLVTRHKGGHIHKTRVSPQVAEIAHRLQGRGTLNINGLTRTLAWLCRKKDLRPQQDGPSAPLPEGVKPAVTPGAFRHSVATWLMNAGVSLPVISTFLGHMSPATTKKFYATLGVAENPMLGQMQPPRLQVVK
jgi:integrase